MKITTYCPATFPGVTAALTNLADVVPGVKHSSEQVDDNADLVILGGWLHEYQLILPQIKTKKAVWFTSSLGQSGLTPNLCEYAYLQTILKLLDRGSIDYLFVGGRKIYYPLRRYRNVLLLPFPLDIRRYQKYEGERKPWQVVFFTPKNIYKNIPNQLIALSLAQQSHPEMEIHINGMEGSPFQLIRDIFPMRAHDYGWLPDGEYYSLLGSAAASLQVTYAEICNYSAMAAMAMGTPVLLSNVVDWLPQTKLHRDLIVGRFDSPEHIAEKIINVAAKPQEYVDHVKRMIRRVATINNRGAIEVLKQLLES